MKRSSTRAAKILLVTCLFLAISQSPENGLWSWPVQAQAPVRRVNAPHFDGEVTFAQRAIFWFGQVDSTSNYADVRLGYNDEALILHVHIFDRWLWYDTSPTAAEMTDWDSVALYLNLTGNTGRAPTTNSYNFVAQLNHFQARDDYQATYRGDGANWVVATTAFTTDSGWRGSGINDGAEARGWWAKFEIPFASLGLASAPASGSVWGMALALHDRDDAAGTTTPERTWPEAMDDQQPATWGQLAFDPPGYNPPIVAPGGTVTIRHGLNGASVVDGHVGGHSTCGQGLNFWTEWGNANYQAYSQINIQNQWDVSDWPCFSKYYVTFPLQAVPAGKVILGATLTLHQFGNAGDGFNPGPQTSHIQVLTVAEAWHEATLTWNNAPLALENVSMAQVDPVASVPNWPGVARQWDLTGAVAEAYQSGQSELRLALYEADDAAQSGKYFYASDAGAEGRPTLAVVWGNPGEAPAWFVYLPLIWPGP